MPANYFRFRLTGETSYGSNSIANKLIKNVIGILYQLSFCHLAPLIMMTISLPLIS